jgi:uncharacterized protein (TIGR00255 family)
MPAPLRSMTGFARTRRPLGDGEVVVSVKTVNHRGLDVQVRAPEAADPFEGAVRAAVKARVARGHVEVRISLPMIAAESNGMALNHELLEAYLTSFRDAALAHGLDSKPDLNAAFRVPGMFEASSDGDLPAETETALMGAVEETLQALNAFREREGAEIADEMRLHNAQLLRATLEIETIRSQATAAFQNRLEEKLRELLKGVQLEPQRLIQEAAVLADRSDVGEEMARLKIHSAQLAVLLDGGGEVGKKLDFLLQEMNRETNTILSKTGGIGDAGLRVTDLALQAKSSIEKIREQALNLE